MNTWLLKVYYPAAHKMHIGVTGDRISHRILGTQIMGNVSSEVSKRVDVVATIIFNELKMENLSDINLSYTPPLSIPWDPVPMAAQAWSKKNIK